jgi:hypothetical protein
VRLKRSCTVEVVVVVEEWRELRNGIGEDCDRERRFMAMEVAVNIVIS